MERLPLLPVVNLHTVRAGTAPIRIGGLRIVATTLIVGQANIEVSLREDA
jgi:hypothetical protein